MRVAKITMSGTFLKQAHLWLRDVSYPGWVIVGAIFDWGLKRTGRTAANRIVPNRKPDAVAVGSYKLRCFSGRQVVGLFRDHSPLVEIKTVAAPASAASL